MKEKNPKVEHIKKNKKKINMSSLLFTGICLFLTVGLFVGLIFLENYFIEDITYKQILVAKKDVPQNVIITKENADDYFVLKSVNILDVTNGALNSTEQLVGQKAIVPLYNGEPVTLKDFEKLSFYTESFEEPVEISVNVENISNAVGGKIRAGDLVNLTMMFTREQLGLDEEETEKTGKTDYAIQSFPSVFEEYYEKNAKNATDEDMFAEVPETDESAEIESATEELSDDTKKVHGEDSKGTFVSNVEKFETSTKTYNYETWAQYVMENLYVAKVLDSSGIEIDSTDTELSTGIIVFIIDKKAEADLNNALANCSELRVSKVVNKPATVFEKNDGELFDIPKEDAGKTEDAKETAETESEEIETSEIVEEQPDFLEDQPLDKSEIIEMESAESESEEFAGEESDLETFETADLPEIGETPEQTRNEEEN